MWRRVVAGLVRHMRALTWKSICVPICDGCTHRSSLFDRRQAASCFRCSVMIVNMVTVFLLQCCGVSDVRDSGRGLVIPSPMDFIMTSKKLDARRVQLLDSRWFKTDHRAVLAVFSLKAKMRYMCETWSDFAWLEARRQQREATETLTDWEIGM